MRSDTFQLLIEYFVCYRDEFSSNFAPQVGMEFNSTHEAWLFWVNYGGQKGFEVRKRYSNKRKSDGKIRSCRFVCANEGHRLKDKRDHLIKSPRAETRTDCEVRMGLVLDREKGNYKVTEVILEHNHTLQLPQTSHLLVSQRKKFQSYKVLKLRRLTMQEFDPKLHMSWLLSKLVAQLISVTLFQTTRTI